MHVPRLMAVTVRREIRLIQKLCVLERIKNRFEKKAIISLMETRNNIVLLLNLHFQRFVLALRALDALESNTLLVRWKKKDGNSGMKVNMSILGFKIINALKCIKIVIVI